MKKASDSKRRELVALHIKEIDKLLQKLSLLEEFKKGKLTCFFCNKVLTTSNIGIMMFYKGHVVFTCNSYDCIKKALTSRVGGVEL